MGDAISGKRYAFVAVDALSKLPRADGHPDTAAGTPPSGRRDIKMAAATA